MKVNALIASLAGIGLLFISGCETGSMGYNATNFPPAPVMEARYPQAVMKSEPIAISKVVLDIPSGEDVVQVFVGGEEVATKSSEGSEQGGERYIIEMQKLLTEKGYDVFGDRLELFATKDQAKARYQLAARIADLDIRIYHVPSRWDDTHRVDTTIEVEWLLFDTRADEVIYRTTTNGTYVTDDGEKSYVILAFRHAMEGLLQQSAFVQILDKSPSTQTAGDADAAEEAQDGLPTFAALKVPGMTPPPSYALPDDFADVVQGIVVIHVGQAVGSGVLISPQGYILTAAHVVSDVESVEVELHQGLTLEAKVLRVVEDRDIALIKLSGSGYAALTAADHESYHMGQDIYTIGAPMGASFSISKGVISGLPEFADERFVQTDASTNPGNSGGPLLNERGEVIAIVSRKLAPILTDDFDLIVPEGMALAIPLEEAFKILNFEIE